MPRQTAARVPGPTHKMKNCQEWALYEPPGTSPEAVMCNGGGWYEGDYYEECPSKFDCKRAMRHPHEDVREDRRSLPVLNPSRPFSNGNQSQVLGGTTNLPALVPYTPQPYTPVSLPTLPTPGQQPLGGQPPRAQPVQQARAPQAPQAPPEQAWTTFAAPMIPPSPYPSPMVPPQQFPAPMQTPFAQPMPLYGPGITPTFLPTEKESIFGRLAKNIAQGWVGATGWHVYDFARNVDMFG